MPSFAPTKSWNFFAAPMNTRVPAIVGKDFDQTNGVLSEKIVDQCAYDTLIRQLAKAADTPFACGFGNVGDRTTKGVMLKKEKVKIPYELSFVPAATIKNQIPETKVFVEDVQTNWYEQVKGVAKKNDLLFTVRAKTSPFEDEWTEKLADGTKTGWVDIANIYLDTDMYTSMFGDERLFFRHHRPKADAKYWPKRWKKAWWSN